LIQNRQSDLAQACCDLRSLRRWAITGTPIQNKLTDFASIVRFLQVYPYSEDGVFEEDISRPWQKEDPQGFLRLKALVRNITISRTKSVVSLPPRMDEVHHLDFSFEEREKYDVARLQTVAMLQEAISSARQRRYTFNALKRLNMLRLICSHGLLTRNSKIVDLISISPQPMTIWNETGSQEPFADTPWNVPANCSNCGGDLLEDLLMGSQFPDADSRALQSSRSFCEACYSQSNPLTSSQVLGDPFLQLPTFDMSMSSIPATPMDVDQETSNIDLMSTKVKAVVADLSAHSCNEKRFV
jgi:SWI/SNF-related matrix-associated actin-dependent regulator of chromatin subfamily A3